ncbi:alcohol dehydrogenase [Nasonia vitripennis]|uniref:Uncharacterized protein n=1 Tax=Nasonia vitripennis TaxID=7425 RepID=A0A7M7H3I1_NASVI|nr:alcohol dehydrogenase [Nasonia vitripennis]
MFLTCPELYHFQSRFHKSRTSNVVFLHYNHFVFWISSKMDIIDKVAIVTGGLGGIGFSTVQHLLREKVQYVAIFDLPEYDSPHVVEGLKKLEEEFGKGKFGYYHVDVANTESFTAAYAKVVEHKGYVDILVNNAAVADDKDIDLTINVNLTAVIKGVLHAVEQMGVHKNHKGGVVVNIASFLGLVNRPLAPVYNASKHGVVSFVRSMKQHNKTLGVRVVCICPGMTRTNMVGLDTFRKTMFDFVPTEMIKEALSVQLQKPDNVASAIVEIIKKGDEGDVWVAQNDEPPFAVEEIKDVEKMKIPF